MKKQAVKNDWVQIHQVVLSADQRAPQIPKDTKKVPLEMKTVGFLLEDKAMIGDTVTVQTVIGRTLKGTLLAVNPRYQHDFGRAIPELLSVGHELRTLIREGEK